MSRLAYELRDGHQVALLQGAAELYATLGAAVDVAQHEVLLETYILDPAGSTAQLLARLMAAARRGVRVCVLVDGVGTGALPARWQTQLYDAGVQLQVYEPLGTLGLLLPSRWRRLHRKLAVVDRQTAFCGGINLLDDLLDPNLGALELPRLDYAVRVSGPLVAQVHQVMLQLWTRTEVARDLRRHDLPRAMAGYRAMQAGKTSAQSLGTQRNSPGDERGGMRAALLLRDNLFNRYEIERAYRRAIGAARREVVIANAYFLPGRKLRHALVRAAQRGVRVRLLLQGQYEYFMAHYASRPVYRALLRAGVQIHLYAPSMLHAKVAVIDTKWATVGSSNLDPLSLLLAREANVVIEDRGFAEHLHARLDGLIARDAKLLDMAAVNDASWVERLLEWVALGALRLALFVSGKRY